MIATVDNINEKITRALPKGFEFEAIDTSGSFGPVSIPSNLIAERPNLKPGSFSLELRYVTITKMKRGGKLKITIN